MNSLKRVEAGEAILHKGDTRLREADIDAWYQEQIRETGSASKRPYLYGSDAGLCARRNVLLEHNTWIPTGKSPATAAYMAIGVGLEDMLAAALKRRQRLLAQGQRLVDLTEVKISGKIDLIVFDHDDQLALVEVKTCGELPTEPKAVHLAQIQTYAAVSGIHRCWLTYISRNVRDSFTEKLSLRSFPVDCSEDVLKGRLATALLSRTASDSHRLPPIPATFRKHNECHYCEFRDQFCWRARPGLGGDEPDSPLPEMSPKEMIEVNIGFQPIVDNLYSLSIYRKLKTLKSLNAVAYSTDLYQRYMKERVLISDQIGGISIPK